MSFFAQKSFAHADSAWVRIEAMPIGAAKLDSAVLWVEGRKMSSWDTSWFVKVRRAEGWAIEQSSFCHRADITQKMITYLNYHQQFDKSKEYTYNNLHYSKRCGDDETIGMAYRSMGRMFQYRSEVDSALHYFQLCEKHLKAAGLLDKLWISYMPRAEIQADARNNTLADELFEASWESVKYKKERAARGYVLFIALQHFARTKNNVLFDTYFDLWHSFLAERKTKLSDETNRMHANTLSFFSSDLESAEKEIRSGIAFHKAQNNNAKLALFSLSLGELYYKNKLYFKAIKALDESEKYILASNHDEPTLFTDIYQLRYESYKNLNQDSKALESLERLYAFTDSLTRIGATKKLQDLEKKYEAQALEVELHKKEDALYTSELKKNLLIISIITLLIGGLTVFYFFQKLTSSREEVAMKEHALQEKIIEDLTKQKQVSGLHAMIEGQEKERLRIARDLHDGLGSYLTSIKVNFNELNHENKDGKEWSKVNELIDQACVEVRKISHNMMPHALSISGIEGAIEDLGEILHKNGIETEIEILGDFDELGEKKAIMLYRILQELINNIVKHSGATTALIQLIRHGNEINLIAEDNGCGFNTEGSAGDGIGLKNLRARLDFLDGHLDIDSQIGEGTTITLHIPMHKNQ